MMHMSWNLFGICPIFKRNLIYNNQIACQHLLCPIHICKNHLCDTHLRSVSCYIIAGGVPLPSRRFELSEWSSALEMSSLSNITNIVSYPEIDINIFDSLCTCIQVIEVERYTWVFRIPSPISKETVGGSLFEITDIFSKVTIRKSSRYIVIINRIFCKAIFEYFVMIPEGLMFF